MVFIILILKLETVDSLKDTFVYYFICGAGGIILNGYMIFSEHNLKWIFPAYAVVDVYLHIDASVFVALMCLYAK